MSNQNQMERMDTLKRRGRGCFLWLSRMMVLFLGLMLAGAIYESVAEAAEVRAYPPFGQMVDVGGYRLHKNCIGTGSPTVVIDIVIEEQYLRTRYPDYVAYSYRTKRIIPLII